MASCRIASGREHVADLPLPARAGVLDADYCDSCSTMFASPSASHSLLSYKIAILNYLRYAVVNVSVIAQHRVRNGAVHPDEEPVTGIKSTLISVAASILWISSLSPGDAHGAAKSARQVRTVVTTFRLHVIGRPPAHATFWVAFGPLADRWGLIQLHAAGGGTYTAAQSLPEVGRTIFAYLAGQGVLATQMGPAPGNPVVTIRRIGPVSASQVGATIVRWREPSSSHSASPNR